MIGNQLKTEIKKSGLTQKEAADLLGITLQALYLWFKSPTLRDYQIDNIKTKLDIDLRQIESNSLACSGDMTNILLENERALSLARQQHIDTLQRAMSLLEAENAELKRELADLQSAARTSNIG